MGEEFTAAEDAVERIATDILLHGALGNTENLRDLNQRIKTDGRSRNKWRAHYWHL
jgi:hypothetical protein